MIKTQMLYDIILQYYYLYRIEHGGTFTQRQHNRKLKLYRELQKVYEAKEKILVKDSNLFHALVEEHHQHHTSSNQISNWLSMIQPIIKQSKQQFKRIIKTKPIYDYFKRKKEKNKEVYFSNKKHLQE